MALITTQKCLQKRLLGLYIICLNIRKFEKTDKIAGLERRVPFSERSEEKIEILNSTGNISDQTNQLCKRKYVSISQNGLRKCTEKWRKKTPHPKFL